MLQRTSLAGTKVVILGLLLASGSAQGAIINPASGRIRLIAVPPSTTYILDRSYSGEELSASASAESGRSYFGRVAGAPTFLRGDWNSVGSLRASDGSLGVELYSSALFDFMPPGYIMADGDVPFQSQVDVTWSDRISLQYTGDGPPPPMVPEVFLNFSVHGLLFSSLQDMLPATRGGAVSSVAEIRGVFSSGELLTFHGASFQIGRVDSLYNVDRSDELILGFNPLVWDVQLDGNLSAPVSWGLTTFTLLGYGIANSDFLGTLELESITFEDGSTPESHGYQIVFESGLQSPNLEAAVPEPATATLSALGLLAVCFSRRRRNAKSPSAQSLA